MSMPLERKNFTYKDYLQWPYDVRCEIIDGVVYNMTPAPSRIHQELLLAIATRFSNYLENKSCKVYPAPFDVRLPKGSEKEQDIDTVVEPDIVVVCDPSKLDDRGCKGAPDLIVEILSPSTSRKDVKTKFTLYERSGVKEYWIVYPSEQIVHVYKLDDNGKYANSEVYTKEDDVKVGIFEDLTIRLQEVFK